MAQILGATPNRRPTWPPAVAACQRAAPPASVALQIAGISRVTTRCDQRSCHQRWLFLRTCPARRLPALGPGHEPWTGPPKGDMGGPGITGLLGTGLRAMPLRAAPGEKLGAAACAARTKRNAQPAL